MEPPERSAGGLTAALADEGSLGEVTTQWREFAESRSNAFVSPEWAIAYAESARDEVEPHTIVVRDAGGEVRGVVPLVRKRRGGSLSFAGAAVGDLFHPACAEADEAAVAAAAGSGMATSGPRARLALHHVPAVSNWPGVLATAAGAGAVRAMGSSVLPYADLAGLDWDGYLARRSRSFRKRVRYLDRSIERDHDLRLREAASPADVDELLVAFFCLHDLRWASESSLSAERHRAFHRAFAQAALERGWLRLRVLEFDGVPAAAFYGWRIGSRYCFYQSGLDTSASRHSLGTAIVAMAVRAAIDEGAATFELMRGDEPYKLRFADHSRGAETLAVAGSGADRALSWGEERMRALRRRVLRRGSETPA